MARRTKLLPAMRHAEAVRFPLDTQQAVMDWNIFASNGAINFSFKFPGMKKAIEFSMIPEEAFEMREDIGHAYDAANGI